MSKFNVEFLFPSGGVGPGGVGVRVVFFRAKTPRTGSVPCDLDTRCLSLATSEGGIVGSTRAIGNTLQFLKKMVGETGDGRYVTEFTFYTISL